MKKLCVILLCLLTIHSAFAVERWAIVIGIGDYPADSGWNNINGDRDIEIIVPMLHKFGFPQDNIITLTNQSATKQNIKDAVYKNMIPKLHNGDIVYFHFSGHGQQISDLDGDEEDGWDEAMIPYDAKLSYDANGYRGENHIVDDELNSWLHDIRKRVGVRGKILVVLDACHSGGGSREADDTDIATVRGTDERFRITQNANNQETHPKREINWVCISACQSGESNYEYKADNGKRYGRLSWCLSKTLTADTLVNELETAIMRQYQLLPPMPFSQTVHMEEIPTYLSNQTVL